MPSFLARQVSRRYTPPSQAITTGQHRRHALQHAPSATQITHHAPACHNPGRSWMPTPRRTISEYLRPVRPHPARKTPRHQIMTGTRPSNGKAWQAASYEIFVAGGGRFLYHDSLPRFL